jgi:hypothetical protein
MGGQGDLLPLQVQVNPNSENMLARPAIALMFPVPGARASISLRQQANAVLDFAALDVGFRLQVVARTGLAHHANLFFFDQFASVEQPRMQRFHFVHIEGKFAMEVSPGSEVETHQAAAAENGQRRLYFVRRQAGTRTHVRGIDAGLPAQGGANLRQRGLRILIRQSLEHLTLSGEAASYLGTDQD